MNTLKRIGLVLATIIAVAGLGMAAVVPSTASAQFRATGAKFTAYDTATNDVASAAVSAPTGGNHLVIYGIDATCETAAAFTVTVTEDKGGGDAAVLGVFGGYSATNHHVEFPNGLSVTQGLSVTIDVSACGSAVDGHATVWGQTEANR